MADCILPGQPTNTNPLNPTGFTFFIQRLPNVVFFGQGVNLPSVAFGHAVQSSPMSAPIPVPGDTVTFDDLVLKFMVDENLADWLEVYNWIQALARIKELNLDEVDGQTAEVSDATLFIRTSNRNVNLRVFFRDLFPVNLTGLDFDATVTDIIPIIGEATFKFCYYDVEVVGEDILTQALEEFCPTALPPP